MLPSDLFALYLLNWLSLNHLPLVVVALHAPSASAPVRAALRVGAASAFLPQTGQAGGPVAITVLTGWAGRAVQLAATTIGLPATDVALTLARQRRTRMPVKPYTATAIRSEKLRVCWPRCLWIRDAAAVVLGIGPFKAGPIVKPNGGVGDIGVLTTEGGCRKFGLQARVCIALVIRTSRRKARSAASVQH